jgi:tetratricopeptide (TPR) repeat protein
MRRRGPGEGGAIARPALRAGAPPPTPPRGGGETGKLRAALLLAAPLLAALLLGALLLGLGGCALRYAEGEALERQGRWEEAMQAYRDAVIDEPDDSEYRAALQRAEKVVARDNFERYQRFLADKAFRKAYARLVDAARQDPDFAPVREELAKWERVLVGGQVQVRFDVAQSAITLAEEITLVVRINTPNPGETLDAPVDIDTGTFFAEDLLYDRPNETLALYSLNAIGVELVFGHTRIKQFTSRDFQRFVNIRTPVLDNLSGRMELSGDGTLRRVQGHRAALPAVPIATEPVPPPGNPHYTLRIEGQRIHVDGPAAPRADFTPRFLYLNRRDRRAFVDFGRYAVRLPGPGARWELARLPLAPEDYFPRLSRNIALQPYFFYREGVFTYVPGRSG